MKDAVAAASGIWDDLLDLAERLRPADWQRPTPCAGWTVKDVLGHCSGVQRGFDAGEHIEPPEGWTPDPGLAPLDAWTETAVAARRPWSPDQIQAELAAARAGHVARLSAVTDWSAPALGPTGATDEQGLLAIRLFDLWVHLQDLRMALGEEIQPGDTSAAARAAHTFVVERAPWMFAKKARAPEGARLRVALGAFDSVLEMRDGRAGWNDAADPGDNDNTVRAAPEAFTLLCSGRDDADTWRARGLLDWSGPLGEAFVSNARLFA